MQKRRHIHFSKSLIRLTNFIIKKENKKSSLIGVIVQIKESKNSKKS